jgi:hypothetical protein
MGHKPHIRYASAYRDWMCIGRLLAQDPTSLYTGIGGTPAEAYSNWLKAKLKYVS